MAQPGEFTLRAFLAGRLDLTQAEAVLGVIEAVSQRQLDVALTQLAGGLSARFHAARQQLLNLCADLEAGLDFVDEDLQFISPTQVVRQMDQIQGDLDSACNRWTSVTSGARSRVWCCADVPTWARVHSGTGCCITTPHSSPPLPARRAITWKIAWIWDQSIAHWSIRRASINSPQTSAVDQAAQQMSHRSQQQADLIVLCLDPNEPLVPWELQQLQHGDRPTLFVLTKLDRSIDHACEPVAVAAHRCPLRRKWMTEGRWFTCGSRQNPRPAWNC